MRHRSAISHAATPLFSDPRQARVVGEFRRMGEAVDHFAAARHYLANLGPDPLVEQLASSFGFRSHDLSIKRLVAGTTFFTVVVVPRRFWSDRDEMWALKTLKAEARQLRTRCILVPHGWLSAPKRSAASRLVARCRNIPVPASDRGRVLRHVGPAGLGTVASCASVILDHRDPYGAIFALVARGDLEVDRSGTLGPDTHIWIPTKRRPAPGEPS